MGCIFYELIALKHHFIPDKELVLAHILNDAPSNILEEGS